MAALQGYKTYILAGLIGLVVVANQLGYIDSTTTETLLILLGAGTAGTIAAKVNRVDKKIPFVILPLLLCLPIFSSTAYAHPTVSESVQQTQPAQLIWDYAAPLTEVQSYEQRILVNGNFVTATPSCSASSPTQTLCSVPVTINSTGVNTVHVSATRNGVTAEATLNVDLANGPKAPSNGRIKLTITVTIGG